ncbi:hypothetical protein DNTS_012919 [Danionella cerebrum]|uniref:Uncharacterized protein n=1 Tax=Danionella cerebrum TaxID=2873325 RepID=A0A553Q0X0_9TELE|nr:hypothetical protein DNTS_012919 [Danionella translucida]
MCASIILSSFNPAGELSLCFSCLPHTSSSRVCTLQGIQHLVRSEKCSPILRHHFLDFTAGPHRDLVFDETSDWMN